jgi:hypothetical protein
MVHPFDKILTGGETGETDTRRTDRRRVLKLAAGGVVAALAGQASGQVATTLAIGEEGGRGRPKRPPMATTKAMGEEGGNPGGIVLPGKLGEIAKHSREFRISLRAGDVEAAADSFQRIEVAAESAKPKARYKSLVANYRKQLDAGLTSKLKRADRDLGAKKLIPAVKGYRAVSRVHGFKQQEQAKGKLVAAEKLDGYGDALAEVKAQELYDTAAKAKNCDKLSIYKQVASEHGKTATGKKAAKQAKDLEARMERDETAAAGMLEKAKKAKGATKTRMLRTLVSRYPDTTSGKAAAEMLPKAPVRVRPPAGGPIMTTMAIGEEG